MPVHPALLPEARDDLAVRVDVSGLWVRFGEVDAVRGIDLGVAAGDSMADRPLA